MDEYSNKAACQASRANNKRETKQELTHDRHRSWCKICVGPKRADGIHRFVKTCCVRLMVGRKGARDEYVVKGMLSTLINVGHSRCEMRPRSINIGAGTRSCKPLQNARVHRESNSKRIQRELRQKRASHVRDPRTTPTVTSTRDDQLQA